MVINRRSGSTLNDPTTWGKDVVILDCWLKECYLLEEVLSGARDSISAQLIFNKPAYEIEGANSIGEGASAHWKGKYSAKDIFSLKTRSWGSEEHVPWVKPSARNALSAPSV